MMRAAARWGLVLALCLSSCNGCDEEETPPTSTTGTPSGERHLVGGVPVGTVEGIVRLAPDEEAPAYADSPFEVPTAGQLPSACSPPHGSDRRPVAMDDARGLSNVGIVATPASGQADAQHWIQPGEPVVHEVHIRDCRLEPATITATTGDTLHVVNENDYPFMPELGLGMLQAVLPSDPLDAPIDRAGPHPVQCAFAAPCGRMEVMAFHHPVHAVSTDGGHFRLDNVPADQDVTLTAWHPTLRMGEITTRVTEGGTVQVEIVVHRFDPPPPPASIVLPPGQEIDPGSPHDTDMTPERLQELVEQARRMREAEAGVPPPPSSAPPSSAPPPSSGATTQP